MSIDDRVRDAEGVRLTYDAFISYSHAADGLLAPRLQSALQRFAKPWWQRRAIRVFRDESSLSANPHLWSSITDALDNSAWFVLLLSPEAAQSEWVNREVEYWRANKDPSRILPVVTDGDFDWTGTGTAFPPALAGAFAEESRLVDLRWARSDEHLDLNNARFRNAIADVASTVRAIPKDELESEEVRQHRRMVRTAWTTAVVVLALAIAAVGFAIQSGSNAERAEAAAANAHAAQLGAEEARDEAETERDIARGERDRADREAENAATQAELAAQAAQQAEASAQLARSRELAASAVGTLEDDPELAILLALASIEATPDAAASRAGVLVLRDALQANPLIQRFPVAGFANQSVISPDGSTVYHSAVTERAVKAIDVATGAEQWRFHDPTTIDGFWRVGVSPDGATVVVTILDLPVVDDASVEVDEQGNDAWPARLVFLDAATGSVQQVRPSGACPFSQAWGNGFSPDGRWFAVSTGTELCGDEPGQDWIEIFDTRTWTLFQELRLPGGVNESAYFSADSSRVLLHARSASVSEVRTFPGLKLIRSFPASAVGAISPDGQRVVLWVETDEVDLRPSLFDVESGHLISFLDGVGDFPSDLPYTFSPDGELLAVTTRGPDYVFDGDRGRLVSVLPETSFTYSNSFSADGRRLLTTTDGGLLLWDIAGGLEQAGTPIELAERDAAWINPNPVADGLRIAVGVLAPFGDEDGIFTMVTAVIDERSGAVVQELNGPTMQLEDGRFVLMRTEPGDSEHTVGPISVVDPDSGEATNLTTCSATDSQLESGAPLDCDDPFLADPPRTGYAAARDGSFFVVASYVPLGADGLIRVWDARTLALTAEFSVPNELTPIGADSDWILFQSDIDNRLWVYTRDGDLLSDVGELASAMALVADGSTLLIRSWDGDDIELYDTERWEKVGAWGAHNALIRGIAISGDGTLLATSAEDDLVKIWDITDLRSALSAGRPPELVDGIPAPQPSDVAWLSPDRIMVFLAQGAKQLEVDLSISALVSTARAALTRDFSVAECFTYQLDCRFDTP